MVTGVATYQDGTPAAGARIALANPDNGSFVDVIVADRDGHFNAKVRDGDYAIAVAATDGFAWIAKQHVPAAELQISLSKECARLTSHVAGRQPAARLHLERRTHNTGDVFVTPIGTSGNVELCLPAGEYTAQVDTGLLSKITTFALPAAGTSVQFQGFPEADVKRAAPAVRGLRAAVSSIVDDFIASKARVIGLGESTHGTAELVSERGKLLFELVRRTDARVLLFELDAITSLALDDYINGGDVDLKKAIPDLGFWITDTEEFIHFLDDLRKYNATIEDKVHLWGIDLQNTTPPVNVLLANATALGISPAQQAIIKRLDKRAKAVLDLPTEERRDLDATLVRLSTPKSERRQDLILALAAKSLLLQLGYWDGEMVTWYAARRDVGMAELARFLMAQLHASHAVLWAHITHVSRDADDVSVGAHLAKDPDGYYGVGFYQYQGSARAWDAEGTTIAGHAIPTAPPFTVEGAVMKATGMPEVAWLSLRALPPTLKRWLKLPRYVREVGAVFPWNNDLLTLRDIRASLDAIVVVRRGHDTTPTPTATTGRK
jgi:erythromycin esterase